MAKDYTEFFEELFGRGAGDPDVFGYPGEEADTSKALRQNQENNG